METKINYLEKIIVDSNKMLEMVLNNIPQHIFWKDINSVFLGCNRNFSNSVGLESPDDIVGKTDFDISDYEMAKRFIEMDKRVISTNEPIYGLHEFHKDFNGNEIWINVNKIPLQDENGDVIGILGTFEDITEKVMLSKKIIKNAKKYKDLIDHTNTAYMIMDTKLHIIEANNILSDLMEIGDEDIVGRSLREWISSKDISSFDDSFEVLLNNGTPINDLEWSLINDNDSCKNISISANIIENGGRLIFCLLRDLSCKKIEEERKYIEQQKKKDKLKQNIQEIRGKLRNIRIGTETGI